MADETRQSHDDAPNEASAKEKAEGSRENVNIPDSSTQQPTGITNRSREEEQREQSDLPPRGQRKDGGSHA